MITWIGLCAGEIWHRLERHEKEVSLDILVSEIKAPKETILMAIGWLGKEGHVRIEGNLPSITIKLNPVSKTNTQDARISVEDQVTKVISEQLGVTREEVVLSADLVHDLGAESLDTVEMAMALEEAFQIEIPDEDIDRMKTVQDVVRYLKKRLNKTEEK